MNKQMKKLLAAGLALCLILSAVPVSAASVEQSGGEAVTEQSGAVSAAPSTPATPEAAEVTVIQEEESLRGEYEKHYLMSDGTYQAVVYGYPVHELVNGVWVELPEPEQNARGDVSPGNAQSNIIDNYVWEGHGVQSSSGLRLYIGNRSGYKARAFIRFATMPTIPAGATITAATMTVHMVSGTSTANNARAYQVTGGSWTSGGISWANAPAANTLLASNISHNNKTKYQFSCLTAVRHWYNGSTTGQNQNYGIMLRYENETIADYNSVYSADCTDPNSRPSMTITYLPGAELDVDVGATCRLYVSGTAEEVTWESDDTSVATVDANGVVTGIKAGVVVVTAYVGGEEYTEFTIWVTVPDGVYYLKSASAGLYLTSSEAVGENDAVKLNSKVSSGSGRTLQLWRIAYAGGGRYSIRSMSKLNMGLRANATAGSAVGIANIGMEDYYTSLPSNGCWGIEATTDGSALYFNHTGLNTLGMRPVEGAVAPGMNVKTADNSGGNYGFRWTIEQVTGIFLYDKETCESYTEQDNPLSVYVFKDDPKNLSDVNIGMVISCYTEESPSIHWQSSDPDIVSVHYWSGVFTRQASGTATITGTSTFAGTVHTFSFSVGPRQALSIGGEFLSGADVEEANDEWTECGYEADYIAGSIDINNLNEELLNVEILYFSTHGLQHEITFYDNYDFIKKKLTDNTVPESELSRSIENMTIDRTVLCVYLACLTASNGDGTGKNLCTATVEAGADCVVGWPVKISPDDAFKWQRKFFEKLEQGGTVAAAVNYANGFMYDYDSIKTATFFGNGNLVIANSGSTLAAVTADEDYINIEETADTDTLYSDEVAMDLIQKYFGEVQISETDAYQISKTYTSEDRRNYVADFKVYRGLYSMDVGFTVLVEDQKIVGIRNNLGAYTASNVSMNTVAVEDMELIREQAYHEALAQVHAMSEEYTVENQSCELYYDCASATRYCRVYTEYCVDGGACGVLTTLYPIDDGGLYEK